MARWAPLLWATRTRFPSADRGRLPEAQSEQERGEDLAGRSPPRAGVATRDDMSVESQLQEMGFPLPPAPKPVAAYVPALQVGNLVYTSGQICLADGQLRYRGKVGRDLSVEQGYEAARLCCLNALAAVKSVTGDLDRVVRVVKVTGFVNSAPGFAEQPKVMNGASELLGRLFGAAGQHVRSAVGAPDLPLDSACEVELVVEVRG